MWVTWNRCLIYNIYNKNEYWKYLWIFFAEGWCEVDLFWLYFGSICSKFYECFMRLYFHFSAVYSHIVCTCYSLILHTYCTHITSSWDLQLIASSLLFVTEWVWRSIQSQSWTNWWVLTIMCLDLTHKQTDAMLWRHINQFSMFLF